MSDKIKEMIEELEGILADPETDQDDRDMTLITLADCRISLNEPNEGINPTHQGEK